MRANCFSEEISVARLLRAGTRRPPVDLRRDIPCHCAMLIVSSGLATSRSYLKDMYQTHCALCDNTNCLSMYREAVTTSFGVNGPTPAGVPVNRISPDCNGAHSANFSSNSFGVQLISFKDPNCVSLPLTANEYSALASNGTQSPRTAAPRKGFSLCPWEFLFFQIILNTSFCQI